MFNVIRYELFIIIIIIIITLSQYFSLDKYEIIWLSLTL